MDKLYDVNYDNGYNNPREKYFHNINMNTYFRDMNLLITKALGNNRNIMEAYRNNAIDNLIDFHMSHEGIAPQDQFDRISRQLFWIYYNYENAGTFNMTEGNRIKIPLRIIERFINLVQYVSQIYEDEPPRIIQDYWGNDIISHGNYDTDELYDVPFSERDAHFLQAVGIRTEQKRGKMIDMDVGYDFIYTSQFNDDDAKVLLLIRCDDSQCNIT